MDLEKESKKLSLMMIFYMMLSLLIIYFDSKIAEAIVFMGLLPLGYWLGYHHCMVEEEELKLDEDDN